MLYSIGTLWLLDKDCDIALNPRPMHNHYRFKSNNKTLIAWANEGQWRESLDDLEKFDNSIERTREKKKIRRN